MRFVRLWKQGRLLVCTCALSTLSAAAVLAEPPSGGGPPCPDEHGSPRHKPPAEAYDACSTSSKGDQCQLTFHDQRIDGTCATDKDDNTKLFCQPSRPPGPPPAAMEACRDKERGAACEVDFGERHINGTCAPGRDARDALICMPKR